MSPLLWILAFLGGIVPAFIWLFFWLLEDRCQPEPKRYIFFSFLAGMIAVILVLPVERFTMHYAAGLWLLLIWAVLEELFKFGAAYFAALRTAVFDEPLDAVVYLVTAALGFSAAENMLFLLGPLQQSDLLHTLITGDLRFMGAMLLHTLASATIGIALAFSFYKSPRARRWYALGGLILAIILHAFFNFFILTAGSGATFMIFLCVWVGIIAVLLFTERVKQPAKDYC